MIPLEKPYFFYLQVEITGQILSAKGLEIHLLLVCNLSRILEKPISKPTEMGATSASGKSVVMRVFSSHQQQHFIIKRNQKCNFKFKTIFWHFQ